LPERTTLLLCLAAGLAFARPAWAEPYPTPIKVGAGPLSQTLREIARQSGGELLFDRNLVGGLQARQIDATTTALAAVQTALAGTSLSVRRAASGALIIEAATAPPLARQDVQVSEVLVIGHRTQNADIRRQETDIQPYRVTTLDQIASAHVDSLTDYFDTRVTSDADNRTSPSDNDGHANSQINLRGLGTDQTLVLIDGRRMPDFSPNDLGVTQPDLNGLPLHAIDRVETLTGTAGGIYGYGALGGVVNVVLAHDRPGAELHVTTGLSSRGDAGRVSVEGRLQFSPDQGATEVTLSAAVIRSDPLTAGARDYLATDLRETYRIDPSDFLNLERPHGNGIAVFDAFGAETLTLKPQYGGTNLGSMVTFLPSGFNGTAQDLATALVGGAGKLNFGLSKEDAGTYLGANPQSGSLLMNVRHQFGGGVEVYFDGVMLWDHGRYVDHSALGEQLLYPSSPNNPFNQYVFVTFPMPATMDWATSFDSSRFTTGLVAPLPFQWRATAEASWGAALSRQSVKTRTLDAFDAADANPFGDWTQFQKALLNYPLNSSSRSQAETRYLEQSLRMAGPVFETAAGPATLTVLAERRSEDFPGYLTVGTGSYAPYAGPVAARSTTTTSVYAELRSRLFDDKPPVALLRDLEVQLAVRDDDQSNDFALNPTQPGSPRRHVSFSSASYTLGAKASPLSWLMMRGSFATGETPPPWANLVETTEAFGFTFADPKRSGDLEVFSGKSGGSPNLKTVLASTVSVGVVLTPFGQRGPQFSLDYSDIRKTHDLEYLYDAAVIAHEDTLPGRVRRGPLTDEDRALGYTAGPITFVDSTAINGAGLNTQTIDARFEWSFAAPVGWLHLYGGATYNFDYTETSVFGPSQQLDGGHDGPLKWRANGGVDWSLGTLTLGINVQYYGSYSLFSTTQAVDELNEALQGSDQIPAQTYVDLHVGKRFHVDRTDLRVDLGVSDLFDTAPPRVNSIDNGGYGVSGYGDPRRRRFELSISAAF